MVLGLPTVIAAHQPRSGDLSDIGLTHVREHAKLWKAQAKTSAHWREMSRAERRRARRSARRGSLRSYARARSTAGEASDVGSWAPPFVTATDYEGFAVHAAMLQTGKVLMWGGQGPEFGTETYAWLWDPAQGYGPDAFRDVTPTDANGANIPILCSGMSFLPDGRLLVVGGTLATGREDPDDEYESWAGLDMAVVFDPAKETWTELPRPEGSEGRWYPTQVLLPDGRTLVVSGFSDAPPGRVLNDAHEIYDAETNSFTPLDSPTQRRATELYPHLTAMPDGTVLLAGPSRTDSAIFDPEAPDPWTDLPQLSGVRVYGNAVLLPHGTDGSSQVALIGGHPWGEPSAAANEVIDLDDPAPSWSSFPALDVQRFNANTVLLPDRSLVTIGGEDKLGSQAPERAVELYDPATHRWRTGPGQVETRAYHSTALLLPDGRVLSTGDDWNPTSDASPTGGSPDDTGEIYSPPYLFRGPRPVISAAPDAVRWDVPFGVGATGDIDDAVLIAPSAVTHANDMTQRLVPLETVSEHPDGVTLQSPPAPGVAPPGWYMLFLLDDGVPSVARWVRLDGAAGDVPVSPADETAPTLRLRYAKRRWLGRLRRNGRLGVKVRVEEAATVELALLRRKRRVAHKTFDMEPGRRTVRLRLRRGALRRLRSGHVRRLRFSAMAIDAAANETVLMRVLRPRRSRGR